MLLQRGAAKELMNLNRDFRNHLHPDRYVQWQSKENRFHLIAYN